MTTYTILTDLQYKESCDRCGSPLCTAVAFYLDGKQVIVGRECAKHYGITWTEKIGPAAEDPEMYNKAVEIWREKYRMSYGWPGGWDACQKVKNALGTIAWKKAQMEAYHDKES